MIIIILIILVIFGIRIYKNYKIPKIGCMTLVTGGVKTGKSTLSVHMAIKRYKKSKRYVRFVNIFRKIFNKSPLEEPLLYSNIPLSVPYVKLTQGLVLRKYRFRYGSVVYVNEASLFADSQMVKDLDLNERLLMFNKLIGHELLGGYIIYDTQSICDVHYSIKRCMSNYFYIHKLHDLRHTFATLCASNGLHPAITQKLLGHATPEFTLRVYTHVNSADYRNDLENVQRKIL